MTKFGQMVLKESIGTDDKIRSYGLERGNLGTQYKKSDQMVLKGVDWVNNTKIKYMVLKGVKLLQNAKIWSNNLERSQLSKLGSQCKNQFIWS